MPSRTPMKRANPILKKILGFCANSYYPKQYLPDKPGFFSSSQHFAGCNLTRDVEVHSTKANLRPCSWQQAGTVFAKHLRKNS